MNNTIYVLLGPTAVGKTAAAIELAKCVGGEIVSADSVQVYRELNIGSAKPTKEELAAVKHHMINVSSILRDDFTVSVYRDMAFSAIDDIISRGLKPIIVGGTGLYINSLTHPLALSAPFDDDVRKKLTSREEAAPGVSYEILTGVDEKSAARLHKNDIRRIIRALEVYEITGKPMSAFGSDFQSKSGECRYAPRIVGLTMDRQKLYSRIDRRVDVMMTQGLLDEVRACKALSRGEKLPALSALGYKQLLSYLDDECDISSAIDDIKCQTRRFAKRQWTWFRRDERIKWLDVDAFSGDSLQAEIAKRFFYEGN